MNNQLSSCSTGYPEVQLPEEPCNQSIANLYAQLPSYKESAVGRHVQHLILLWKNTETPLLSPVPLLSVANPVPVKSLQQVGIIGKL